MKKTLISYADWQKLEKALMDARVGYEVIFDDHNGTAEMIIDVQTLIECSRVSWHDNTFIFEDEVEDGQIINVQVKWAPFTYESNIFTVSDDE